MYTIKNIEKNQYLYLAEIETVQGALQIIQCIAPTFIIFVAKFPSTQTKNNVISYCNLRFNKK